MKDSGGKYYSRTQDYYVYRLIERMPSVVPNELAFYRLSEQEQRKLLGYEWIREAEETELAVAGRM